MKRWGTIPNWVYLAMGFYVLWSWPTLTQAGGATALHPNAATTLAEASISSALRGAGMVYLIAIVISIGVAMLIKLLGKALKQFKGEP